MNKLAPFFFLWILLNNNIHAQKIIRLYDATAPGSENWTNQEYVDTLRNGNDKIAFIRNVCEPTLTVFLPKKDANGTAVIICPGGAFRGLAIDLEGTEVANWLNSRGITAIVLKYRLVNAPADFDPQNGNDFWTRNYARIDSINAPFQKLAIEDGRAAVKYVRDHAAELQIQPNRVGMMGFSAGGALAIAVSTSADSTARPDFVAPIYAYVTSILKYEVPRNAPPIFFALASDDRIADGNELIYQKWRDAGGAAELHIYQNGGHGFALKKQNLPCDLWVDRFMDWLERGGYLMTAESAKTANLDGNWGWHQYWKNLIMTDWANLQRYSEANKKLLPPEKSKKRVVFFGDSITEGWLSMDPPAPTAREYVWRGIGGQTTPQMLVRFRPDVLNLKPSAVVILAGTNDIAENTGKISIEQILGNLASMAEIGKANGIKVILCSVLPAADYPWRPGMSPDEKIPQLNAILKDFCQKNKVIYLDYFEKMVNNRNGLSPELAADGVHPTLEGYKIMREMVEKVISETLD